MLEIVTFFAAGSALGGLATWLHDRKPSTLVVLCGIYATAFTVCCLVGQAIQVGVLAFIAPYVLVAVAASVWSAGLLVRWPASADRSGPTPAAA